MAMGRVRFQRPNRQSRKLRKTRSVPLVPGCFNFRSNRGPMNRGEVMSKPTTAGRPQPLRALQLANQVRRARSQLKARIADGQLPAAEIILTCPSEMASMPIVSLLESQRGWGEVRSRAFLAQVAVAEDK